MFMEREAKITRLFFAFLMFVWLATSSSFVGAEGASGNYVHVADGKYSTGTSYSTITNPPDTDIPSDVGGVVGGAVSSTLPTDYDGYFTESIIGGQVSSGDANKNYVLVENGDFKFVYGADGVLERTSTGNTVEINDGNIFSVYASRWATIGQKNTVILNGGNVASLIGATSGSTASLTNTGNASFNQVQINEGTVSGHVAAGVAFNGGDAEQNTVDIKGGTINGYSYGAFIGVAGMDATVGNANYNSVVISGGTVNNKVFGALGGNVKGNGVTVGSTVTGDVYGGSTGDDSNTNSATSNRVSVNDSTSTTITNGNEYTSTRNGSVTGNIYGGYVGGDGTAESNTVTAGGTVNGDVYGGYTAGIGNASSNTATVWNWKHSQMNNSSYTYDTEYKGNVTGNIYGGYAAGDGNAESNISAIYGIVEGDVYGGYTKGVGNASSNIASFGSYGIDSTSSSNDSNYNYSYTTNNKITGNIYGGYAAGDGSAEKNSVNSSSGSVTKNIYGGYAVGKGNANENSVSLGFYNNYTLSSSTANTTYNFDPLSVGGDIYGGYATGSGTANNNHVMLYGDTNLSSSNIYGGYSVSGTSEGNTLTVMGTGNKVKSINNFQNINFQLSLGNINADSLEGVTEEQKASVIESLEKQRKAYNVANGDTMLTAETANIEGTKITGYVQGDTDLKEGDTVTLLEATTMNSDDNTTYNGSVAEGISFNHELNVKRDGNKILATVGGSETEPTTSSASNNTVIVNESTYTVNGGEETSYSGVKNVYGGHVYINADDIYIIGGLDTNPSSEASNNTVKINGGDFSSVYGGEIPLVSNGSKRGNSNKNTVEIFGGTITSGVYGGHTTGPTAKQNTINIRGGTLSGASVVGGLGTTSADNVINISGGTLSSTHIYGGGFSQSVSNNTVNINSSPVLSNATLYGGFTYTGANSNNTINIKGSPVLDNASLYGGFTDSGIVSNNTINISDSPVLNNASLYGGISGDDGTVSGNTLNIHTKNIKVGTIAGFDNINFHIDTENNKSNVTSGDTMLTAETANIEGAKITGYVQGDTDLKEGDTVTLLDAETLNADDNTTYTGSVAEGISFNHELNVKRDGNKILATVGEAKKEEDEPTPATGDASNNTVTLNDSTYKINNGEEISYSGSKNIYGGIAGTIDATNHIVGGNATSGDASSNTVNINSGNLSGANVYGGYASTGAASNNTINISGTSNLDNASIYGGYVSGETSSTNPLIVSSENSSPQATTASDIVVSYPDTTDSVGAASNNTINITDAPSLTGASIYGGYAANGGATSGNTLNIRTKNISAKSIGNFENINFYLDTDNNKSNVANGDTLLKVETADIQGAKITGLIAGDTNLSENDKVTLLEATNLNSDTNTTYASSIAEGISFKHKLDVMNEGNKITATVKSDTPELLEQTTVIPTAPVSAPKMVTAHIDNTLNWLPSEDFAMPSSGSSEKSSGDEEAEASKELGSDVQTEKPGYEIFGNIGASSLRTNTGNGSYVDSKTNGINLGFAKRFDSENGNRTYIAPLFDFGGGSYESHLASGIKGKGHTHFTTGGVIARRSLKNGTYFESSFRMGKTTMDFATDDLVQGDTHPHVAYNTSAPVWAAHLNVGRRINLSPKDVLNLYGIYFHTHQGGMDAKLTTGETYQFNSVTNQRLRVGARLLKWAKPTSCFYSGVAYQWESVGAANATYKNQTTHNVGASGSSFMIELGWQVKPAATSRIAIDIGAVGWLGHQRGGSAHVKFNYSF